MNNEIVACDGCGIMVHEVCYGILDTVYSEKSKKNAENETTKNEGSFKVIKCVRISADVHR